MITIKTIFGEPVNIGDRIMYFTVQYSQVACIIAIVTDKGIEKPKYRAYSVEWIQVKPEKEYGGYNTTMKKRRLTNPCCIKWPQGVNNDNK